jgi:serine/threonine protein kinase
MEVYHDSNSILVAHNARTKVYVSDYLAYKYISKLSARKSQDDFPLEIDILLKLKGCDKIVQLVNYFEMPTQWCIVMKKPKRCMNLMDYAKKPVSKYDAEIFVSESVARRFVKQIIKAIENCYEKNICHRDIKAENVLVDLDTLDILLIDFGSASYRQDVFKNSTGTFLPPEYIRRGEYKDEALSVYCIGILLYQILTKVTLCYVVVVDFPNSMSFKCQNFIAQCLLDENDRPTLADLARHPWLL